MHFHLPKPLHGWRQFAGEVAIIVLGVFIALFLEQVVQRLEWDQKISAAEGAMKHELLWDDGPQLYQRAVMHPCMVARLNAIRAAVETNQSRADISKAIDGYWIIPLTYDTVAHQAADASDVSSHIPQGQLQPFVLAYAVMPRAEQTATDEGVQYANLRALKRSGGALSDGETSRVLSAVEQLRKDDLLMWYTAAWTLPELKKLGALDPDRVKRFRGYAIEHYGSCVKELPANYPNEVTY